MSVETMTMAVAVRAPMSILSTAVSDGSSLEAAMGRRPPVTKSTVEIQLDNHFRSRAYNTGSPLSGQVTITTQRDVRFDDIEICLIGRASTQLDGVGPLRTISQTFLKMSMPVPESAYPVPRILEAGRSLTMPFNFVIPSYLTINACSHWSESAQVRDQHTRLPPTMGFGHWDRDDFAPQMANIEYSVKARVWREPEQGGRSIKVLEASQPIRVLPSYSEEPPLNVTDNDRLYTLTKSKSLRKNLLSTKLGRLTATVSEPDPVFVGADGRTSSQTEARVELSFEPASAEAAAAPPRILGIQGRVTAHTFYSSGPVHTFPNLGDWMNRQFASDKRGAYATNVPLAVSSSSLEAAAAAVSWTQLLKPSAQPRRDSGYGSEGQQRRRESTIGDRSDSEQSTTTAAAAAAAAARDKSGNKKKSKDGRDSKKAGKRESPVSYSATLRVPVKLPTEKKAFIPTFHSCIASRVYSLSLQLTVAAAGGSSAAINLVVPLQVVVSSNGTAASPAVEALPSFEEAAADEFLRPRLIQVPNAEYMETSVLPGYART